MDITALSEALDQIEDSAVVHHGFTDYMRDYEVVVHVTADPRTGVLPAHLRYLFRYCVAARCETSLEPWLWQKSLDDRLIDHATADGLDGWVWGVKWANLERAQVLPESDAARWWAGELGIDFHAVRIETQVHDLDLVFSELEITELPAAWKK
ncbi:hypothetical protein SAMN06272735_7295 [Streptomyces sp. TLI_55]|uniref:YxiG-like protein n=1 Tax=Streptomyces sp. TLI_55 TaxID=1938861 RepID=UPI000BC39D75|nr:hypothetical protein [Streptomyces sp. TLI_55]SNX65456.1 hypothetical protein SAMN06272735_7295 [Streptomyces sp. TLI_55]